jgi:hypothetical protein
MVEQLQVAESLLVETDPSNRGCMIIKSCDVSIYVSRIELETIVKWYHNLEEKNNVK